jgi:hypothetical protein
MASKPQRGKCTPGLNQGVAGQFVRGEVLLEKHHAAKGDARRRKHLQQREVLSGRLKPEIRALKRGLAEYCHI